MCHIYILIISGGLLILIYILDGQKAEKLSFVQSPISIACLQTCFNSIPEIYTLHLLIYHGEGDVQIVCNHFKLVK